ncbi:MAG: hypothetical protein PVH19_09095 [Planctomycetia bacterium]
MSGIFGGYLGLNLAGRPLEFHCTAPIRPNRAQEILYGPTLRPFLYGEQIGQTLLQAAKIEPLVVCTDSAEAMAVAELVEMPVLLVAEETPGESFMLGMNRVALARGMERHRELIEERIGQVAESFDLSEPFVRIREAIDEARSAGSKAA